MEIADLNQLEQANADLYAKLQGAVDTQIVNLGHVPGDSPSTRSQKQEPSGNGTDGEDGWKCSEKQRDLILKIVDEHRLDKGEVDDLARQRYGVGVRQLNKLQASGLIDELLETHGKTESPRRGGFRQSSFGRGRR